MISPEPVDELAEAQPGAGFRAYRAAPPPSAAQRLAGLLGRARLWLAGSALAEWEAGRAFLWLPVCLGIGIAGYFALPREPLLPALLLLAGGLGGLAVLLRHRPLGLPVAIALALVASGAALTKLRTDLVAAPVLGVERAYEVSGFVARIDRSGANGVRLLILVRSIAGIVPGALPHFVRLTMRSNAGHLRHGDAVTIRARLRPPDGPPLPGGYDFARTSFYLGIGGTGFALGQARPAELGPAPFSLSMWKPLADLRAGIGRRIEEAIPGENGRIAVALTVGDQGGISDGTLDDLRDSGLAHILSISGLHMVLVAGVALYMLRAFLALIPGLALHYPIKKWSAAGALLIATIYLGLSGAEVPTQRSYVMLAIMLVAIMVGRRALSLRNVALAALLILATTPEALLTPSFQMSFGAAAALVSAFEAIRKRKDALRERRNSWPGRLWSSFGTTVLTSLVASFATAPFAAFHFQRLAPLSILANLLATPAISFIVMPMALAAVLLMPFGLEAPALWLMSSGLDIVRIVAQWVAGLSEGAGGIPMVPMAALLLFSAGFLFLILCGERWRLLGLGPMAAALLVAALTVRPDILVSPRGDAVALRQEDGRYRIIGARGGFLVESWLRSDGDARTPGDASLTAGTFCDSLGCTAPIGGTGKRLALVKDPLAFGEDCQQAAIVVSALQAPEWCAGKAFVIDRQALRTFGAHALSLAPDGSAGKAGLTFDVETVYPPHRRAFMPPAVAQ
jgi:competence protein ComEC